MLIGEGQYNLHALKEVVVTESYLQLDRNIRRCQNDTIYEECLTNYYTDAMVKNCGCLPPSMSQVKIMSWGPLTIAVYQTAPTGRTWLEVL